MVWRDFSPGPVIDAQLNITYQSHSNPLMMCGTHDLDNRLRANRESECVPDLCVFSRRAAEQRTATEPNRRTTTVQCRKQQTK